MPIARIALDVPLPRLFDYRCPPDFPEIPPGTRVVVPFGPRRLVGIVVATPSQTDVADARLRDIAAVLTDTPALPADWLALCSFCAQYYQRPLGEVLLSALPPRLKRPEPIAPAIAGWAITDAGRAALANPSGRASRRRTVLADLAATGTIDIAAASPETARTLRELTRAGHAETLEVRAGAWSFVTEHALTSEQQEAVHRITGATGRFQAFLLFGITGSGKTEVYMHLIEHALHAGRQVLVLVPEINLTPQLAQHFRSRFEGVPIVILHSNVPDNERALGWLAAQTGRARIVLGTRMAVFTPFADLGLLVVDEEHDASYKQQDGVRYSARDLAVYRAREAGIPIVLGSATPSLETWSNARAGRYQRIDLPTRARTGATLPTIRLVDTRATPETHGITNTLIDAVRQRIERGEQSLIFLNRRGYAPVLACSACGWVADCTRCAAHLVVHMDGKPTADGTRKAFLRCHHCGHEQRPPRACPDCGNVDVVAFGRGTQRLEDSITALFPDARILRIDSDSIRNRGAFDRMRERIAAREVDILVGTQILAKGHDFPQLTLVGILNSDAALMAADYRAPERLFAQLQQVAGRAGRAGIPGEVLIQTRYPDALLYQALVRHDYTGFAERQLEERAAAGFPPATAEAVLRAEAHELEVALGFLRGALAVQPPVPPEVSVYDPVPMSLPRLSGWERAHVLVQAVSRRALQGFLAEWVAKLQALPAQREIRWHVDVDPLEF